MRDSLVIVGFFIIGVVLARFGVFDALDVTVVSKYTLYLLMFSVGLGLGLDRKIFSTIRKQPVRILLLPVATTIGTFAGAVASFFILRGLSFADVCALSSGFGYYSLSSIFLNEMRGAEIGTMALAANIVRELLTLLFAPLMVKWFGKLAPISSGGATTADTTLPVIAKVSGSEFVPVSVFHGVVMDISVPFWLTVIMNFY